jgi:hypothetical protein
VDEEEALVMRATVIYESMFGNTREIASAVAEGIAAVLGTAEVEVVPVGTALAQPEGSGELVVLGGPTHVHGMSRPSTRSAAADQAADADSGLHLEHDAVGPGLREWLATIPRTYHYGAAFDTKVAMPFAGSAAKSVAKALRHRGVSVLVEPENFFVTRKNALVPGERDRAVEWGRVLATRFAAAARPTAATG